jgi:polyhydroxybutyrate depolymerase
MRGQGGVASFLWECGALKLSFTTRVCIVAAHKTIMKSKNKLFIIFIALAATSFSLCAEELARREWNVDGVVREALVHVPPQTKSNSAPVVFAFHGHGGTMRLAARTFHYENEWPEAVVVYMQGLNTPGRLTDPEGKKPGWQHAAGDHDDRDLKFFDAVLASLEKDHRVDKKRVYATGHSNGGGFSYLLWATRGKKFAAFAPSACVARVLLPNDPRLDLQDLNKSVQENTSAALKNKKFLPKPVLHLGAENDPLVKFEWQKLSMAALRKLNDCGEGKPWDKEPRCTIYESKAGAPVITYIHEGKHGFPPNAPAVIVKFFKEFAAK